MRYHDVARCTTIYRDTSQHVASYHDISRHTATSHHCHAQRSPERRNMSRYVTTWPSRARHAVCHDTSPSQHIATCRDIQPHVTIRAPMSRHTAPCRDTHLLVDEAVEDADNEALGGGTGGVWGGSWTWRPSLHPPMDPHCPTRPPPPHTHNPHCTPIPPLHPSFPH